MEAIVTPASRIAHGDAADPSEALTWMQDAACRAADPDVFFPGTGQTPDDAVAVCRTCPVRDTCAAYAIAEGIDHGVYGGLTPADRVVS